MSVMGEDARGEWKYRRLALVALFTHLLLFVYNHTPYHTFTYILDTMHLLGRNLADHKPVRVSFMSLAGAGIAESLS
jgi:hypothetical protein